MKLLLTAFLALAVSACATVQPNNAGQRVLDVYRQYTDLAEGAAAYGSLAFCDTAPAGTVLCADRSLVEQIKVVRDNSEPVVKRAKEAALQPGFYGTAAERWVVIAQGALKALQDICTNPANANVCVAQPAH